MIFVKSRMIVSIVTGGGALLLAVLTPAIAPAASTGTCNPSRLKFLVADATLRSTTSGTFVNLPQGLVGFTQGGTSASCVVVRFSAETRAPANSIAIRMLLDDATPSAPVQIQYSADDGGSFKAHAYDFIFTSVTPGKHSVRIQYKSSAGGSVDVSNHTVAVQYAP